MNTNDVNLYHSFQQGCNFVNWGPGANIQFGTSILGIIFNWSTFLSTGSIMFVSVFSKMRHYRKTFQMSHMLIRKVTKAFLRGNPRHETQSCEQLLQLMIQPMNCVKTPVLSNVLNSSFQKFMDRN